MSQNKYIFNILDFFYRENINKKFLQEFENFEKWLSRVRCYPKTFENKLQSVKCFDH
jgi:hypothetical protein